VGGKGAGQGGEMTQALYAHMNNKTIKKKRIFHILYTHKKMWLKNKHQNIIQP
jgi:hypothetical protein